jgi:hypothetical protein
MQLMHIERTSDDKRHPNVKKIVQNTFKKISQMNHILSSVHHFVVGNHLCQPLMQHAVVLFGISLKPSVFDILKEHIT